MSGLGTDVLAVVCIMGGAAVSGGATLAALRGDRAPALADCATTVVAVPRVSVIGDGPVIAVRPHAIRVRGGHGCASVLIDSDVRVRIDEARVRADEARVRVERARERVEAARTRADAARARIEAARVRAEVAAESSAALREALERAQTRTVPSDEIRARLQEELAQVQKELARLNGGGGAR